METLKFKTNINCGGCIAKVTPFLNADQSIEEWQVDTNSPDKILTVKGKQLALQPVRETVEKAGFKVIDEIKENHTSIEAKVVLKK